LALTGLIGTARQSRAAVAAGTAAAVVAAALACACRLARARYALAIVVAALGLGALAAGAAAAVVAAAPARTVRHAWQHARPARAGALRCVAFATSWCRSAAWRSVATGDGRCIGRRGQLAVRAARAAGQRDHERE
jgi:hypothetical protein